jgi:Arc/MetJ-type ribon-helix-helix transcriptional regulator
MKRERTKIVSFRVPENVFAEIEELTKIANFDQRADLVKSILLPGLRELRRRTTRKVSEPQLSA